MKPGRITSFSACLGRGHDEITIHCEATEDFFNHLFDSANVGPMRSGVVVVPLTNAHPRRYSTFRALSLARAGRATYQLRNR